MKVLNRGENNSCCRSDLIFKPLPDSKLAQKRPVPGTTPSSVPQRGPSSTTPVKTEDKVAVSSTLCQFPWLHSSGWPGINTLLLYFIICFILFQASLFFVFKTSDFFRILSLFMRIIVVNGYLWPVGQFADHLPLIFSEYLYKSWHYQHSKMIWKLLQDRITRL